MAIVTITYRRRLRQRRATVRTDHPDLTICEIRLAQQGGHGIWLESVYVLAGRITHAAITF